MYDLCVQALQDGRTVRERFGYSDEDAFAVGLTCGGVIEVLVTPVRADAPVFRCSRRRCRPRPEERRRHSPGWPGARTNCSAGRCSSTPTDRTRAASTADPELDRTAAAEARAMLDTGRTGTVEIAEDGSRCPGGVTLFVESSVPPPRMIVFGAVDFATALVRAGKFLGYHVTVCDARPVFATRVRFPEADDLVVDWPHRYLRRTATDERTVLCVLTHDAKFDVPLLEAALRLPVAFVGAMGSRRTHEDRNRRLREVGVTEGELARLRSPIGLDLGARTPEETALSIAAEIVAARRGGTGVPLTGSGTPIHHDADGREAGEARARTAA